MIVVFDAQCLLCNRSVHFLLGHDDKGVFQFASFLDWRWRHKVMINGRSLAAVAAVAAMPKG